MFVKGLEIPETIEITKLLLFLNVIMDCDFYLEGCQCYYEKSGDLTSDQDCMFNQFGDNRQAITFLSLRGCTTSS